MKNVFKKVGALSWVLLFGGLISAFTPVIEDIRKAKEEEDDKDKKEEIIVK